jgi:hypothetical protein
MAIVFASIALSADGCSPGNRAQRERQLWIIGSANALDHGRSRR